MAKLSGETGVGLVEEDGERTPPATKALLGPDAATATSGYH
jgi:hypothetical protein